MQLYFNSKVLSPWNVLLMVDQQLFGFDVVALNLKRTYHSVE